MTTAAAIEAYEAAGAGRREGVRIYVPVRQTQEGRSHALTLSCAGTLARAGSLSLTLAPPFVVSSSKYCNTRRYLVSLRFPDQIPSLRGIPGSRFSSRDPPPLFL